MNKLNSPGSNRLAIQVLAASAAAALLSGCSADATRFNNPFSSPFASNTAAKPQHVAAAKPMGLGRAPPVVAQALPPRQPPVASAAAVGVSHETTGSIPLPSHVVAGTSFGGWSAAGGTAVVVAQGDTADILSKRYGVPANVLLQVNGLASGAEIQPGARITVPIYNASAIAGSVVAPARVAVAVPVSLPHPLSLPKARVAVLVAPPVVAPKIVVASSRPGRPVIAASGRLAAPVRLAVAAPARVAIVAPARVAVAAPARVIVAPARVAVAVPARVAIVAPARVAVAPVRLVKGAAVVKTALLEPAVKAKVVVAAPVGTARLGTQKVAVMAAAPAPKVEHVAAPAPKVVDQTPTASVPPATTVAEAPAAGPEFRWPARGRIIQGFKGGAGGNDGINIAVPEGTAVKAAEGGTVIYAGTEMKAYGSMVLIRHPNGFISAYANNGEIDVKKGDAVKRGQTIAKSGQSGNVSSPQLHFELRKGRDPVDPTQFLAGL